MKHNLLLITLLLAATMVAAMMAACTTVPPASPTAPVAVTAAPAAEATAEPATPVIEPTTAPGTRTLTVMTHDSFSVSEDVVAKFQAQCGCTVQFLKSGDTGLALNKAILSKNNPLADVFYGVDNTFLSRGLAGDIFEPYASPALARHAGRAEARPQQPAAAGRLRLRDAQLRQGLLRRERPPAAADPA